MGLKMTHWERIRAALRGEETDRVPISLWRHWPTHEETALGLVSVTLRWQREFDFDLVKVSPMGTYPIEDWGAKTKYFPNPTGVRTVLQTAVQSVEEYPKLKPLEVTKGCLGQQLDALGTICEELKDSAPVLMTVFSPLTVAQKLVGNRVYADLRRNPDLLKEGLQIITETMVRFSQESLRAGAHGIFFATQADSYRVLSEAEFREFGVVYDRMVLDAVRHEAEILLLHAHGEDIMLDVVAGYPVDALNWHDRLAGPSLAEVRPHFSGMLVGGIDEWHTLLDDTPAEVQDEIEDAIRQADGRGFMVGPGCVIPVNTPVENIRAAREAVTR